MKRLPQQGGAKDGKELLSALEGSAMIQAIVDDRHEGQQVAAAAGIRDRLGQPGAAPPE